MGTEDRETSSELDLNGYFLRRAQTLQALDTDLEELARQLMELIPPELERYKSETFWDIKNWLIHLENNTRAGSCNSDRIKEPETYGFADMDDAYRKMQLLKSAWAGIIDVEVSNDDWYVEVRFRLAT